MRTDFEGKKREDEHSFPPPYVEKEKDGGGKNPQPRGYRSSRMFKFFALFALVVFLLVSYYAILYPYLSAALLALLTSLVLTPFYRTIYGGLRLLTDVLRDRFPDWTHSIPFMMGLNGFHVIVSLSMGAIAWMSTLTFASLGAAFVVAFVLVAIVLLLALTPSQTLASFVVASILALSLFGFAAALSGGFYLEARRTTERVVDFLQTPAVQVLIHNREESEIYLWIKERMERIGLNSSYIDPVVLKENAANALSFLARQSNVVLDTARHLLSDLSDYISQLVFFFTLLAYLLQNAEGILEAMVVLSPFSRTTTERFFAGITRSFFGIMQSMIGVGLLHMAVTYFTFWYFFGIHTVVLSFVSGLLATLPILSSWIVWVPASAYLFLSSDYSSVVLFSSIHLILYSIDSVILERCTGIHPYAVSVAIILGLYSLGPIGSLLAPILVCTTVQLYGELKQVRENQLIESPSFNSLMAQNSSLLSLQRLEPLEAHSGDDLSESSECSDLRLSALSGLGETQLVQVQSVSRCSTAQNHEQRENLIDDSRLVMEERLSRRASSRKQHRPGLTEEEELNILSGMFSPSLDPYIGGS